MYLFFLSLVPHSRGEAHHIIHQCTVPVAVIVPVARYSACEIACHLREQPVGASCGVVRVAIMVPPLLRLTHTDTIKGPQYRGRMSNGGHHGHHP